MFVSRRVSQTSNFGILLVDGNKTRKNRTLKARLLVMEREYSQRFPKSPAVTDWILVLLDSKHTETHFIMVLINRTIYTASLKNIIHSLFTTLKVSESCKNINHFTYIGTI